MKNSIFKNIDLPLLGLYGFLVILGILNIYSTSFDTEHPEIYSLSKNYGRQVMWFGISLFLGTIILFLDSEFIRKNALIFYAITTTLLVLVLFVGTVRGGARAWFGIGGFGIQPAEFAKITVSLLLAKYLSSINISIARIESKILVGLIIFIPIILILKQPDLGTVLVFLAFILVLYREGISGNILLYGLLFTVVGVVSLILKDTQTSLFGFEFHSHYMLGVTVVLAAFLIFLGIKLTTYKRYRVKKNIQILIVTALTVLVIPSIKYGFEKMPEKHYQRVRVEIILGLTEDPLGVGYNSHQALSAIGSGKLIGKGYRNATLANDKFNQVPEQSTDFIFCTIAEEWGFIGSFVLFILFMVLIIRIILIAERQRSTFTRVYGYSVAGILFVHFTINIGMVMGIAPIIGIPLPFFSYGGSSLLAFSIMIFILLKLDSDRYEVFR